MLFDLRGRRRRAVQATYLLLALLMGGGLVFFGIGGDVSGGLFDAFSERGGGSGGNDLVEERVDRNRSRLAANPRNEQALKALVRDYHSIAVSQQPSGAMEFPDDAKDELRQAGAYWNRYLELTDEPDPSLALVAWRVFDIGALDRPKDAAKAMAIIAEDANDYQSYLQLVNYAALAGDERTADLATQKAVDLAPKKSRKQVERQAEQLKKAAKQQQAAG
jgi:hypothetical protein